MGNIRECSTFEELWFSDQARKVRGLVATCPKNCWMVGTAAPVMKKYIKHPAIWVAKNKLKSMLGKPVCIQQIPHYDVGQNPLQGDLRADKPGLEEIPVIAGRDYALTEDELKDMLADE